MVLHLLLIPCSAVVASSESFTFCTLFCVPKAIMDSLVLKGTTFFSNEKQKWRDFAKKWAKMFVGRRVSGVGRTCGWDKREGGVSWFLVKKLCGNFG